MDTNNDVRQVAADRAMRAAMTVSRVDPSDFEVRSRALALAIDARRWDCDIDVLVSAAKFLAFLKGDV